MARRPDNTDEMMMRHRRGLRMLRERGNAMGKQTIPRWLIAMVGIGALAFVAPQSAHETCPQGLREQWRHCVPYLPPLLFYCPRQAPVVWERLQCLYLFNP